MRRELTVAGVVMAVIGVMAVLAVGVAFYEDTMRFERFFQDARELIEDLRGRLGQDKIVLLGHSWGTQLGIELVNAYPEYFHAYIGVSQVVNHERATELARDWLLRIIDPDKAPGDLRMLQTIEIPARRHSEYRKLNRLTNAYGGSLDVSIAKLARIAVRDPRVHRPGLSAPAARDEPRGGPMHEGGMIGGYDFIKTIPAVEVPVYFLMGANDYNTPLAPVREYCEIIEAPHKELIVFEESAHLPFLAEPTKFTEQVIRVAGSRPDPRPRVSHQRRAAHIGCGSEATPTSL